MRLWHKDLISVLPREQLVAQWRELSAIAGSIQQKGTPNHILVNFVLDYDFDHFISYASRPQLIKTEGIDFVDKVKRIYKTRLIDNTNLEAVFNLLLTTAIKQNVKESDIPKTIVVISDMEIDQGTYHWDSWGTRKKIGWSKNSAATEMEKIRQKWASYGLALPKLVYWNVDARHNTILDSGPNVSFVSGMSPIIFKQILTGKTGWDLMIETICSKRYETIK